MCCNNQRQQYQALVDQNNEQARGTAAEPAPSAAYYASLPFSLEFEYTGRTALTVVSPRTGRHYRFDRPGARLEVDPSDRPWLAFVPNLRPAT